MRIALTKVRTSEYDESGKRYVFADLLISIPKASIEYTLEFYDEENLADYDKDDKGHVKDFVMPLIYERVNEKQQEILTILETKKVEIQNALAIIKQNSLKQEQIEQ